MIKVLMGWTTAEIPKYICAQLGAPTRRVELEECAIIELIQRAIRQVTTWKPSLRYGQFTITEGVQSYNFSEGALDLPYGKGLVNVYSEPITRPQAVFNEFEYYRLRQPPYVDMGELVADQMYYKEVGNLTGTNFDWEWYQQDAILLLTPTPTRTRRGSYVYNAEISKIEDLSAADQGWVVDYSLALAKEALGRIRGKFQGVPGNDLGVETDWSELLNEGRDSQESLLEALKDKGRGAWTPPIIG